LPILLPANPLTINTCCRVADFPDLHINLVFLGLLIVILIFISKLEILRVVRLFAANQFYSTENSSEFASFEYFVVIKSGWPSSFGDFGLPGFP